MSDTPEQNIQADDAQAQAGGIDANAQLLEQIKNLEANNRKLLGEKKNALSSMEDLQRQISDLQNNQQKAKQAQLAEQGEYKTLWSEATGTVSSLQDEIAQKDKAIEELKSQFQQQQIKATAVNAFTQSGVNAPEHLLKIIGDSLRLDESGSVVALAGGVQVPLQQHLSNLKTPGSGYEMFFNGSQARGMSATGSGTTSAGGKTWSSLSFTEKVMLEEQDRLRGTNEVARLKAAG